MIIIIIIIIRYSLRSEDGAPNITDSLFQRIFDKNRFTELERVVIMTIIIINIIVIIRWRSGARV